MERSITAESKDVRDDTNIQANNHSVVNHAEDNFKDVMIVRPAFPAFEAGSNKASVGDPPSPLELPGTVFHLFPAAGASSSPSPPSPSLSSPRLNQAISARSPQEPNTQFTWRFVSQCVVEIPVSSERGERESGRIVVTQQEGTASDAIPDDTPRHCPSLLIRNQSAFSLIEVFVALLILSISIMGVGKILGGSSAWYQRAECRQKAIVIAASLSDFLQTVGSDEAIGASTQHWQNQLDRVCQGSKITVQKKALDKQCTHQIIISFASPDIPVVEL